MGCKKGNIPWNKGKTNVYSKEQLERMSQSRLGKKLTVEHKRKISEGNKGRIVSEETRNKIGLSNTGKIRSDETKAKLSSLNVGKKRSQESIKKSTEGRIEAAKKRGYYFSVETLEKIRTSNIGKTRSAETKARILLSNRKKANNPITLEKIRLANTGKKQSPESIAKRVLKNTGKKRTKETCRKISIANKGRIFTPEWRANMAKKKRGPFKDTKPERMMQLSLTLNGIKFEKHKAFKLGKSWHQVDIFIEPDICVEVDGIHWHIEYEDVKRDLFVNQELTVMGYHVIRIRDYDILKNTQGCAETVIRLIKELQYRYPLG